MNPVGVSNGGRGAANINGEQLRCELSARAVVPGVGEQIIDDGVGVAQSCFPGDERAIAARRAAYHSIARGELIRKMTAEDSSDFGMNIEGCGTFVYYRGDAPVGIGSFYHYIEQPEKYWLGRFGVEPQQQRKGFGEVILEHICQKVSARGGRALFAYTDPSPDNAATHRFYERHGFVLTEEIFIEAGEAQRVYRRDF